jgi:hypothetical protein
MSARRRFVKCNLCPRSRALPVCATDADFADVGALVASDLLRAVADCKRMGIRPRSTARRRERCRSAFMVVSASSAPADADEPPAVPVAPAAGAAAAAAPALLGRRTSEVVRTSQPNVATKHRNPSTCRTWADEAGVSSPARVKPGALLVACAGPVPRHAGVAIPCAPARCAGSARKRDASAQLRHVFEMGHPAQAEPCLTVCLDGARGSQSFVSRPPHGVTISCQARSGAPA